MIPNPMNPILGFTSPPLTMGPLASRDPEQPVYPACCMRRIETFSLHFMDAKSAGRHACEVEPLAKQTAEIVKTEA
jgi:hypothetical protein